MCQLPLRSDKRGDGFGRMAHERPKEEETVAQRRFLRVDSSSGSVLPDGKRFEGRGLSRKTFATDSLRWIDIGCLSSAGCTESWIAYQQT
jgi:hypothetical protein